MKELTSKVMGTLLAGASLTSFMVGLNNNLENVILLNQERVSEVFFSSISYFNYFMAGACFALSYYNLRR